MGVNVLSLLEIAGNPLDLYFAVGIGECEEQQCGFVYISRGEGHNWKLLITGKYPPTAYKEVEDLVWVVECILYDALVVSSRKSFPTIGEQDTKLLAFISFVSKREEREQQRASIRSALVDRQPDIDCLTLQQVDWILLQLRSEEHKCYTSQYQG